MSKFFINRPIVAMVISIIMLIAGTAAILSLPTAQFPNIADPQIQVNATYPGADAQTVGDSVATPIEQRMSGVNDMNYMYSLNANSGLSQLTVDFNVKSDPSTDQILAQMRAESGSFAASVRGEQLRCDSTAVDLRAHDAVRSLFSQRPILVGVPRQLRLHQSQLRANPCAGHCAACQSSAPASMPCVSG